MATNTAQIPCSVTPQLHSRVTQTDDLPSTLRRALHKFLSDPTPQAQRNPITREVLIKLRNQRIYPNRNRQITFNVPKETKEEIKALATQEGLTMSAILRRAVYEYTKPNDEYTDENLLVMYDGWGDTA